MAEVARPGTVRIAVVDSGVQLRHPHIEPSRFRRGIGVSLEGGLDRDPDATIDHLGHGTAVAAAIQQWAPEAEITPVRVFESGLRASPRALIAAIGWCAGQGFDLVNLSLGTRVEAHRSVFQEAARHALEAGVVLVAAREAGGERCYPGALPETLGVGLDWTCPRESWRLIRTQDDGGYFAASGYPRPIAGVEQRRNLYGISFAVANMTGLAAAALGRTGPAPAGRERLAFLRRLLAEGALGERTRSVA